MVELPAQRQHAVALLQAYCVAQQARIPCRLDHFMDLCESQAALSVLLQVPFEPSRCRIIHTTAAAACGEPDAVDVVAVHGRR